MSRLYFLVFWLFVVGVCPYRLTQPEKKDVVRTFERNDSLQMLHSIQKHIEYTVNEHLLINSTDSSKVHDQERRPHIDRNTVCRLKCATCVLLVNYQMENLRKNEVDSKEVIRWLIKNCKEMQLETSRICEGALGLFGDEVLEVLTQVNMTAREICGITIPDCCPIFDIVSDVSQWKIHISPRATPMARSGVKPHPKYSKSKKLKVVHLTDIHLDTVYKAGSTANCDEPLCCHGDSPVARGAIVEPMDPQNPKQAVPVVEKSMAGKWGDYRFCDLPYWTLIDMLDSIKIQNPDYILWTGDLPAHNVWSQTREQAIELQLGLTDLLLTFFPKLKIYPAVGNHDSYPSNNFPPAGVPTEEKYSSDWFYEVLADAWSPWLDEEALDTVKKGGFYTMLVEPGFRIVSLNTNFCYTENWWIWIHPEDPSGMLAWFVRVLEQAEANEEHVHVIGHVPPGKSPDCQLSWSRNYYRIMERFHNTISAQFFGHTHFDEVLIYYASDTRQPISVAYLGPSATPYSMLNPAYRVYNIKSSELDSHWRVADHQTYMLNLADANLTNKTLWTHEYSALASYRLNDLSPNSLDKMVQEWLQYISNGNETRQMPSTLRNYIRYFIRNDLLTLDDLPYILPCKAVGDCVTFIICGVVKNYSFKPCADSGW